jgi:uncharacterized protein
MILSLLLGILVGAVMGLTGAGGGILAVPALVAGMGWSMQQAGPVALIAVAGGAALGAAEAWRHGLVRYRAAFLIAAIGWPFTSIGIRMARTMPQTGLMFLFACVMLVVAARVLLRAHADASNAVAHGAMGRIDPGTGRFHWNRQTAALFAVIGAIAGFLSGLLGVGGGFVIVPLLQRYTNVSMHGIVATSLLVIALVGAGGVASAVAQGVVLPALPAALFAAATAIGMVLGRILAKRLSGPQVQRGFAIVLIVVALGLLGKTLAAI